MVIESRYPNLLKVIECIKAKSPFQKKVMSRLIENADSRYLEFGENFVQRMIKALEKEECHDYLAVAYLSYTKSIRVEEMYFAKEHKYRATSFAAVYDHVYGRDDYMVDYVAGLGMTQLFWPNHWAIVKFFLDEFIPALDDAEQGAEVGCGHGLFHTELLRNSEKLNTTLIDISPISLKQTMNMIIAAGVDPKRVTIKNCDIQKEIPLKINSLDVLLLGELIEHIEDGEAVMSAMINYMKPGGLCFFTTAANAPAEDHILLFRSVGEIRSFVEHCGWIIGKEHLGTLNNMSVEESEKGGHNINYAAIISKK